MRTGYTPLLAGIASLLAIGIAACGENEAATQTGGVAGNGVDRAFMEEMILHHRSAVEMAEVAAQRRGRHQVKELARAVISTQNAEIDEMNRWRVDWYGGLSPAGGVPEDGGHTVHDG